MKYGVQMSIAVKLQVLKNVYFRENAIFSSFFKVIYDIFLEKLPTLGFLINFHGLGLGKSRKSRARREMREILTSKKIEMRHFFGIFHKKK